MNQTDNVNWSERNHLEELATIELTYGNRSICTSGRPEFLSLNGLLRSRNTCDSKLSFSAKKVKVHRIVKHERVRTQEHHRSQAAASCIRPAYNTKLEFNS